MRPAETWNRAGIYLLYCGIRPIIAVSWRLELSNKRAARKSWQQNHGVLTWYSACHLYLHYDTAGTYSRYFICQYLAAMALGTRVHMAGGNCRLLLSRMRRKSRLKRYSYVRLRAIKAGTSFLSDGFGKNRTNRKESPGDQCR
jgi:hypothetical protein